MKEGAPKMPDQDKIRLDLAEKTTQRTGLYDDVKNIWNSLAGLKDPDGEFPPRESMPILLRKELSHYGEYVMGIKDESIRSYALEHSDPEKVREFDALVDQANAVRAEALADLESGGAHADFYAAQMLALHGQAMALISGTVEAEGGDSDFLAE